VLKIAKQFFFFKTYFFGKADFHVKNSKPTIFYGWPNKQYFIQENELD